MSFLLHITYPTGKVQTCSFPTAFARVLEMVLLSTQPVTLRIEDPIIPAAECLIEDAQRAR